MPGEWRTAEPSEEPTLDNLAAQERASGFMQSGFWAEFKRQEGFSIRRLLFEDEGVVAGGASLLQFRLSHQPGFVICPEGPVLPWADTTLCREALRRLVEFVRSMDDSLGLRIEPHLPTPLPSLLRNWADAPTDLTPPDTIVMDLSQTEEALLAAAHPKVRYNLKVADRYGVEISTSQDLSFAHVFYGLLLATSNRSDFFIEPFGFFLNLLGVLFERDAGELILAKLDGQLVGALLIVYFGSRATYLYGASSSVQRQAMPAYALHRAAMRRARDRRCAEYDLYGIDAFERRDHLYAGITRFKKQWGGQVLQRIGARDYVFYDRVADLMVEQWSDQQLPDA